MILKQQMLEAVRDYPREYVDLLYNNMGDGVITGFDVTIENHTRIKISPGIIKINGEVFFSDENAEFPIMDKRNYVYLKIEKSVQNDGEMYRVNFIQSPEEKSEEFELLRYTKNAELQEIKDISEVFNRTINRVDRTHMKRSIVGGSTLADEYYELFSKKLRNSNKIEDVSFAYQCMNGISNVLIIKEYFGIEKTFGDDIIEAMKQKIAMISVEEKSVYVVPKEEQEGTVTVS